VEGINMAINYYVCIRSSSYFNNHVKNPATTGRYKEKVVHDKLYLYIEFLYTEQEPEPIAFLPALLYNLLVFLKIKKRKMICLTEWVHENDVYFEEEHIFSCDKVLNKEDISWILWKEIWLEREEL
jgi:hypothetical protein